LTEAEITSIIDGHAIRNRELLQTLIEKGVPVSEERVIEHHFWAQGQKAAALLASSLYAERFLVLTIAPVPVIEGENCWNVEASIKQSPVDASTMTFVEKLTRLAANYEAVYDGWGTVI
jgi:regulator of RNase E activity RraB